MFLTDKAVSQFERVYKRHLGKSEWLEYSGFAWAIPSAGGCFDKVMLIKSFELNGDKIECL
jgi:hypothetical protein